MNDAFGHHVGDLLLAEVAERIGARSAQRHAGPHWRRRIRSAGGPWRAAPRRRTWPTSWCAWSASRTGSRGHELRISVSIGIALYENFAQEAHELLRNADAAMYHAKSLGRSGTASSSRR